MTDYAIRKLEISQLEDALQLIEEVFMEFEAPGYSSEGIREFHDYIDYDAIYTRLMTDELRMWVCRDRQKTVGVIALRIPCHISLLFVDRSYHRLGIARALFETARCCCTGCSEMTVHPSPFAVSAYRKLGFVETGGEQTVNGIRFMPMIFRTENEP